MDRPVQHKEPAARLFVGDPYTDQSIKSGNVRDQTSGVASDLFVILRINNLPILTNLMARSPPEISDITERSVSHQSINQQARLNQRS
jgi:hypothetical protein